MPEGCVLREKPNHDRRKERSEIYAHVEDRESSVAAFIPIRVQLTHHRAYVGLQQPRAKGNQDQPNIEVWQCVNGHRIVATSDNDAANQDSATGSQNSVG